MAKSAGKGRQNAVFRVLAFRVVEHPDVVEHVALCIVSRRICPSPDPFPLQQLEGALRNGVVVTIPASAHAGCQVLFLPPYSPDFNPIEMAFAKLKALLRKAAERSIDGLWSAIGRFVASFTQQECANYFAPLGYDAD